MSAIDWIREFFGRKPQRRALVAAAATASVLGLNSAVGHADDTALILGGSGIPTPPQSYVDAAQNLYLNPLGYGSYAPQVVTTPEQYYPLTGVTSLTPDASVAQGATILDGAVRSQLAAGNRVVVFGYSQGAGVASQEANNLASSPNPPSSDQVSFVLLGDPSSPNGGFNQRFQIPGAPLSLVGVTFNSPPTGGPYPTAVYTQEYDAAADFPQYPINLVSDLNAVVGFFTQHLGYLDLTPQQINSAVQLPTTGGNTTYYMIPTPNLPLLAPVRLIPLVGNPLADLVQPDLRVIVNLGYGNIANGWSPGPANVPTPFGLLPTNINPVDVLTALANGIPQGITNALNDLKSPQLLDLSPLSLFLAGMNTSGFTPSPTPSLLQLVAAFSTVGNQGVPVSSSGGVIPTLTNVVSTDLAVIKPLSDTVTALTVTLPQYDAQLFTSQLASGNLLNAVGLPIAADLGLIPWTLVIDGVFPVVTAAATTVTQLAELAGLQPNPTGTATTASTTGSAQAQSVVSSSSVTTPVSTAVHISGQPSLSKPAGQPVTPTGGAQPQVKVSPAAITGALNTEVRISGQPSLSKPAGQPVTPTGDAQPQVKVSPAVITGALNTAGQPPLSKPAGQPVTPAAKPAVPGKKR